MGNTNAQQNMVEYMNLQLFRYTQYMLDNIVEYTDVIKEESNKVQHELAYLKDEQDKCETQSITGRPHLLEELLKLFALYDVYKLKHPDFSYPLYPSLKTLLYETKFVESIAKRIRHLNTSSCDAFDRYSEQMHAASQLWTDVKKQIKQSDHRKSIQRTLTHVINQNAQSNSYHYHMHDTSSLRLSAAQNGKIQYTMREL